MCIYVHINLHVYTVYIYIFFLTNSIFTERAITWTSRYFIGQTYLCCLFWTTDPGTCTEPEGQRGTGSTGSSAPAGKLKDHFSGKHPHRQSPRPFCLVHPGQLKGTKNNTFYLFI